MLAKNSRVKWNLATILILILVLVVVQLLNSFQILKAYDLQILGLVCINIMLAVSLNLINGFTGQFSIGHAGFFGIGAYFSAYLTVFHNFPFYLALLAGGLLAAIIGIVIGLPALRLKGDYLAIATLGFGEIIRVVILNIPAVGGARGFSGIGRETSFALTYVLAILTIIVTKHFIESRHGRACIAIREDELASDSLGINPTYYKVMAFAIGALIAGIAGGLFSHYMQYISPTPTQIGFQKSIDVLIMVVLGGLGSITGSVIAATILTLIPEVLRGFAEYRMVIYPILLILIMLFRPSGLLGGKELSYAFIKKIIRKILRKDQSKEVGADGV